MAPGGNPIFSGKNFREATQAPPAPQAPYGQGSYGQGPYSQNSYGQNAYGQAPQGMTQEQLQDLYNRPAAGPADIGRMT
ncbi:hypothetical protein GCM10009825_16560 [Arthrobacter humicola]|uniref:Uncharacterized protein n=1 Tax=Arthrobacter humicola TaxID=409291 RepID=A0ABN2YWG3_9MICC